MTFQFCLLAAVLPSTQRLATLTYVQSKPIFVAGVVKEQNESRDLRTRFNCFTLPKIREREKKREEEGKERKQSWDKKSVSVFVQSLFFREISLPAFHSFAENSFHLKKNQLFWWFPKFLASYFISSSSSSLQISLVIFSRNLIFLAENLTGLILSFSLTHTHTFTLTHSHTHTSNSFPKGLVKQNISEKYSSWDLIGKTKL